MTTGTEPTLTTDGLSDSIEKEVLRRLEFATERYRKEIRDLQESVKHLEFRAAVAEWAVAGVLARNLHVSYTLDDTQLKDRDRALQYVGRNVGMEFLHGAELNFKLHAEHCELKGKVPPHKFYRPTIDESVPHPIMWPRPFK